MLWDGGFAGICFPKEYGGLGLTIEHQHAFTEESLPYEMPLHLNVPNFSILGATLVDFGTHEQKAKYLPPLLSRASTSGCSSSPSPPAGPTSPGASPAPSATATSG